MLSSMFSPALLRSALPGAALLAMLAPALSACGSDTPQFAPDCRKVQIEADFADLTQFRGNGTDLTDMVVDGRVTGIPQSAKCSWGKPGFVHATLSLDIDVTRGPAMQGRAVDIPYFVAVARGDQILDKANYVSQVSFPRNGASVHLTTNEVELQLPVPGKVAPGDYQIWVGFQLTPEELAFNRRRGPR